MSQETERLEAEAAVCEAAGRAWEEHVKPFFVAKELELFEAFKDMTATNEKDVMLIKMQANVLAMLKDHFESMINSGKLARKQLEDKEK